jgi:hypothetical protein
MSRFPVLFHGTSSENLPSIKANGLIPGFASGADSVAGTKPEYTGKARNSVFLTDDDRLAGAFGAWATKAAGGNPVVLAVEVTPEIERRLYHDEIAAGLALRHEGKIPARHIVDVAEIDPEFGELLADALHYDPNGEPEPTRHVSEPLPFALPAFNV